MRHAIEMLQRQRLLLQMEYYAEKESFRKQTEALGVQRLVKRGDAWFPLRIGKSYYNSLNQLTVEIFRTATTQKRGNDRAATAEERGRDEEETDHNFEFGRQVVFFRNTAPDTVKYYSFTATVSYADGDRMVVTVPDNAPLLDLQTAAEPVGVQLSFDETTYRAMFDALDRTIKAKDNRLAELRDWCYTPHAHTRQLGELPDRLATSGLNAVQQHAVREVLRAKDVAVVHGPPGTGKTTTLVEAVNETLMRETQVLVCAQSNMAVDWISERLVDRGINVLRIGNPARVNDKMLSFTYERRFEAHPDYPTLWSIRKALRELRTQRKRGAENIHQKMARLKSRATELEIRINADLFGEARVIAATLVGADSRLLMGMKFHTLFIDEAAQALEAACWIPARRVDRIILAGDHCQLPPTVKSIAALKAGLGVTLMERIVANHPETVTLLRIQYRMNEQIMKFSSDWFYGGQVQSAPQIRHRGILDWDIPMEWRKTEACPTNNADDNGGSGELTAAAHSLVNHQEARLTLQTLEDYLTKIGRQRILDERIDVGVISPYRAQVLLLRRLIRQHPFFKPYRRLITVNTVDGFQGQERDIIVISLVRSNDDGQIGFLRDLRRMNVAITRARMKLIILGDPLTLCRHPFYRKLYEHIARLHADDDPEPAITR